MSKIISIIAMVFIVLTSIARTPQLTKYVNPFIGTIFEGNAYPGATLPFGMVQLSPDNGLTV